MRCKPFNQATDPTGLERSARLIAMAGIEGPIVVGHSAGGATISLVPGPTRVDRLVYVTAVVPEPGRSIADVVGAGVRDTMLAVSRDDGNGCRSFDLDLLASLAPPAKQLEIAARLGVEPIAIASEHAVFTFRPRKLAAVLVAQAIP